MRHSYVHGCLADLASFPTRAAATGTVPKRIVDSGHCNEALTSRPWPWYCNWRHDRTAPRAAIRLDVRQSPPSSSLRSSLAVNPVSTECNYDKVRAPVAHLAPETMHIKPCFPARDPARACAISLNAGAGVRWRTEVLRVHVVVSLGDETHVGTIAPRCG